MSVTLSLRNPGTVITNVAFQSFGFLNLDFATNQLYEILVNYCKMGLRIKPYLKYSCTVWTR